MISTYFNDEELRELCLMLRINYDSLGGDGNKAKATRLVTYLERRGRTQELLEALGNLRPNVAWPAL